MISSGPLHDKEAAHEFTLWALPCFFALFVCLFALLVLCPDVCKEKMIKHTLGTLSDI
eukprot:m.320314 g.320314  ORF g.320314 m.320314 type:complete len:58 (+) comp23931_c0_seq1:1580-1753(+)